MLTLLLYTDFSTGKALATGKFEEVIPLSRWAYDFFGTPGLYGKSLSLSLLILGLKLKYPKEHNFDYLLLVPFVIAAVDFYTHVKNFLLR
jgi:hypothetical protein